MTVVHGDQRLPKTPRNVQIELGLEDFAMTWDVEAENQALEPDAYQVKVQYFKAEGRMVTPLEEVTREHKGGLEGILELPYPGALREGGLLKGCTLKVSVTAQRGSTCSKPVTTLTTWDSHFMSSCAAADSFRRDRDLLAKSCQECSAKRGNDTMGNLRVLVVGQQHMGKSSLVNGIARWLQWDMELDDQMAPAPAGHAAKTAEIKSLKVPFDNYAFTFIDTPHFASVTEDNEQRFQGLLSRGVAEGTRRKDFSTAGSVLSDPPHVAILVVDLLQWRDQRKEVEKYLCKVADNFHKASAGTVSFPYVVAATHRDDFLRNCQGERPMRELEEAVMSVKECTLTESVFAVTSYKFSSKWSPEVNEQISLLLHGLVTFAKNQDTAIMVRQERVTTLFGALAAGCVLLLAAVIARNSK